MTYCAACSGHGTSAHDPDCPDFVTFTVPRGWDSLGVLAAAITENHNHFDCAAEMAKSRLRAEILEVQIAELKTAAHQVLDIWRADYEGAGTMPYVLGRLATVVEGIEA